MESHLRAAIRAGLIEEEFWPLTPYRLGLRLQEIGRARLEGQLITGWMSERFAREERLSGPQAYIKQFLDPVDPAEQEAMAEAMFHRMATDWGLEIEPLVEEGEPA